MMKESSSRMMSLKGKLRKNDNDKKKERSSSSSSSSSSGKDQDLLLFRELNKQYGGTTTAATTTMSLLNPLSEEFDHSIIMNRPDLKHHNHKHPTLDFLAENNDKHDYNWLKTPPATPLFLSIEMEATHAPPLQREIPVLQPLSRFADGNNNNNNNNNIGGAYSKMITKNKTPSGPPKTKQAITPTPATSKRSPLTKTNSTKATPTISMRDSRAVSPLVRSSLSMMMMMSNQTPPNLRTVDNEPRRARATTPTSTSNPRMRQSCSPTVSRGRNPTATTAAKAASGFIGSTMVDKVMNARRASANATTANSNNTNSATTKPMINSRTTHLLTTTTSNNIHTQTSASPFRRMKKTTATTATRDKTTATK